VRDVVELPGDRGDCEPMHISGEPLLICVTPERASVYTLHGEVSLDRSFPLAGRGDRSWTEDQDRFAAVPGESLGFLGPCRGEAPRDLPDVTSGASSLQSGRQRVRQFCVRSARGQWVEHEVSAGDVDAVVAWIPRRHGSAAALIGRRGTFLGPEVAVETDGGLLVVRVALEAPPLEMGTRSYRAAEMISTRLRVAPDGAIEGWLISSTDAAGMSSVRIDRGGHVVQHPLPLDISEMRSVGRFAIGVGEHGAVFESVDWGREWHAVEAPPGQWERFLGECTTVGCQFRGVARIGWDGIRTAPPEPPVRVRTERNYDRSSDSPTPLVRLACEFEGAADEKRIAKSYGCSTVSLEGLNIERSSFWLQVGYALRKDGTLEPFVASSRQDCPSALFARLGMLSPMGGCHGDQSMGVEVDGRVLIVNGSTSELKVTSVGPDDASTGRADERRAILQRRWMYLPDRRLAVGRRGNDAFIASFDAHGRAVAARVDLERGRLGEERPLAGLSTLTLADQKACRGRDPDEARYVMRLKHEVGLSRSLFGLRALGEGVAVIRWSERRACLEAIELVVRDQVLLENLGRWLTPGTTNKLIARFDGARPRASVVFIGGGVELRQALSCTGVER